jgi:hypothetical protein
MTRWLTALDLRVQPVSDYAADAVLEGLEGSAGMDAIKWLVCRWQHRPAGIAGQVPLKHLHSAHPCSMPGQQTKDSWQENLYRWGQVHIT